MGLCDLRESQIAFHFVAKIWPDIYSARVSVKSFSDFGGEEHDYEI